MKNRILTLIATSLSWVTGALLIATDAIASSVIEEQGLSSASKSGEDEKGESSSKDSENHSPKGSYGD